MKWTLYMAVAAAGALALAGCNNKPHEEEAKVVTEVAVQPAKVTRATLRAYVEAYGTVEPEPAGNGKPAGAARLGAPAAGVVMAVPVKEGDRVEAGTVIVKLDDRVAAAAVEKARSTLELAQRQFDRQQKLKAVEGTSDKTIQEATQQLANARAELAAARAQLAQVQLASPLAGVVARISVQPGQVVDPATIAAEIVDLSRIVVTASVPAPEAAKLKPGQPAEFYVDGSDKPAGSGKISFVSPQVDPKSGTVLVRISVSTNAALMPGRFVKVRIISEERANKLAVPNESVVKAEGDSVIYVIEGTKAAQRPVKTGLRDAGLVEVEADGLKEGDSVVATGAYGLPKETKIKIATP